MGKRMVGLLLLLWGLWGCTSTSSEVKRTQDAPSAVIPPSPSTQDASQIFSEKEKDSQRKKERFSLDEDPAPSLLRREGRQPTHQGAGQSAKQAGDPKPKQAGDPKPSSSSSAEASSVKGVLAKKAPPSPRESALPSGGGDILVQRYAKMRVLAIRYLASKAMEEARMLGKKPERVRVRWPAVGALPFLLLMLRDAKDWEDRWAAIKLLGEMKQHASQAIPALLRFLEEGQRVEILTELATTFGRIGASANVALPTLRSFYKMPHHPLRSAILYALWKVDPTDQESRLLIYQAIQDPHIQVRLLAVVAIADLRPYEDAMTAYLARAYKDPHWLVRLAAIKGCERLGMLASANLSIFRLALRDPHWQVRQLAARALPALGPRAQKARGDLTLLLRDADARVRKAAKDTLASWSIEQ